jgi:hypothetical protein
MLASSSPEVNGADVAWDGVEGGEFYRKNGDVDSAPIFVGRATAPDKTIHLYLGPLSHQSTALHWC